MVGFAHIYVRVSSEGQINLPGHCSLDVQERACREYCESQGLTVRRVWSEVYSARDMDKMKVLKNMIRNLQYGDTIVFYNITRFSRNTYQGLKLIHDLMNKKRVQVYSVAEKCSYDGTAEKHLFRTTLSAAENESEMISDRVRGAIAYLRSIGSELGNPPYGKMAYRERNGVRKFKEHPDEMRVIDTILQKHYDGVSCSSIADFLNENRIRKRHREWTASMVEYIIDQHAMLRNRSMLRAIEDIADLASDSSSESSDEEDSEEEQPIAKRVKRDIRRRSRSRSRSPARRRGEPLRFRGGRQQEQGE